MRCHYILAYLVIGKANLWLSETQRGNKRTMEISGTNNSGRKIFIVVNLD